MNKITVPVRNAGAFVVPFFRVGDHHVVLVSTESSHSPVHLLGGKPELCDYQRLLPVVDGDRPCGDTLIWDPRATATREVGEELGYIGSLLVRAVLPLDGTPASIERRLRFINGDGPEAEQEHVIEALFFIENEPQELFDIAHAAPDKCRLVALATLRREDVSEVAHIAFSRLTAN